MNWKKEIKKQDRTKSQLRMLQDFLIDLSEGGNPTASARRTVAKETGLDPSVLKYIIDSRFPVKNDKGVYRPIRKNRDEVKARKQRVAERRKLRESPSHFLQSVKQLKDTIKSLEKLSKKYDYDKRKMIDNTIAGLEQQIDKLMSIALDK